MSNEAQQRFLALDVHEVSVVDTPANEVEFLVVKRKLEENKMSAEAAQVTQNAPTVDTTKGIENAMAQVTALVEGITKAATQANAANEEAADAAQDAAVEKSHKGKGEVRKNYRVALKAAGLTGDGYRAALKAWDASLGTVETTETKTEKAAELVVAEPETVAADALTVLTETISKAKVFTPARQKQLLAMSTQLKALIDELIHIPQATMPATNTPALSTTPDFQVSIAKALEELTKSINDQSTVLADTQKRLETIEKARGEGNALPNDETVKTTTKAKSLWGGVL